MGRARHHDEYSEQDYSDAPDPAESRAEQHYQQALNCHPDCRDPEHPGCEDCEESLNREENGT